MIIRLDVTKKQLGFLIAAMSRHLRTEDVKGLLRNQSAEKPINNNQEVKHGDD